jgi:hypothetical protein
MEETKKRLSLLEKDKKDMETIERSSEEGMLVYIYFHVLVTCVIICMYIYKYIYIHICMYIRTHEFLHINVHI